MVDFEEKKSKLVKLLTSLGDVQMEQGNYHEAIKHYEKILSLGFEEPLVYSSLSKAFMQLERVDTKAVNIYRKTLSFDNRNKDVCDWLSQHYLRMNRRDEEAVEIYTQALHLGSVLASELLPTLIHIHLEQNELDKATEVARMGMDFSEFREEAINYFLQLTFRHEQHERSLSVLKSYYKRTRQTVFLKAVCQVLVEKHALLANSGKKLNFSEEDCDLARRLLAGQFSISQFDELQFYVALAYIFQYSREFQKQFRDDRIDEYEFFFSNQSPDVVIKRGFKGELNEENAGTNYLAAFWNQLSKQIPGEDPANTDSRIFNENRLLLGYAFQIINFRSLLLQHSPGKVQKITGNLVNQIMPLFRKNSKFQLRFLADGLVFLAPFHPSMLLEIIEILRETEKFEFQKPESEQCRIFISLHLIDYDESAHGTALEQFNFLLNLNHSFRLFSGRENEENFARENQLFVSAQLVDKLAELESIQLRPLGMRHIKHYPELASVFQIEWADPLERFKAGMLQQLGRFEILNELGKFPIYSVYRGRDNLLERLVLIKTVRKIKARFRESQDKSLAQQYLEETRLIGSLNHRNIIMIYDIGQEPGFIYLAREYFEGKSLKSLLTEENLEKNRIIRLFIQICSALKYAHQQNIFHKNLKPNNIILSDLDEVKVTDFGEMNYYLKKYNTNGEFLSDLVYLPPEQILEETTDGRTDIYALGIILYEILFGEPPFRSNEPAELKQQILNQQPVLDSNAEQKIHPGFCKILNHSLAKDASNRYQTIQEMIQDFYSVLKNE